MTNKSFDEARASLLQSEIEGNERVEIKVGRKTFRLKRLGNWVQGKMDRLVAKSQFMQNSPDKDAKEVIATMVANRTLVPKVISYLVLKHPVKVVLFHGIYWRWLHLFYSQEQFHDILTVIYSGEESRFFFHNLTFLQVNNALTIKQTKADMKSIARELASEAQMTQS